MILTTDGATINSPSNFRTEIAHTKTRATSIGIPNPIDTIGLDIDVEDDRYMGDEANDFIVLEFQTSGRNHRR